MKFVYLIQSTETQHYKIGVSSNPDHRIENLKTGNSSELKIIHAYKTDYPYKIETAFHNIYSHLKKEGEWLEFDAEIESNFIKKCDLFNENFQSLKKNKNVFI